MSARSGAKSYPHVGLLHIAISGRNTTPTKQATLSCIHLIGLVILKSGKKNYGVFFFNAHEKGFKFHVQPQTSAYSCLH